MGYKRGHKDGGAMRKYSDVVIVGAGASGLLCGGLLAGRGLSVTILEKNRRSGKKLSATGNGRCNFTNLHMDEDCYYGDSQWIGTVLDKCTPEAREAWRLSQGEGRICLSPHEPGADSDGGPSEIVQGEGRTERA